MRWITVMLVMAVVGLVMVENVVVEMGRTGTDWVFITCQELCPELHLEHLFRHINLLRIATSLKDLFVFL